MAGLKAYRKAWQASTSITGICITGVTFKGTGTGLQKLIQTRDAPDICQDNTTFLYPNSGHITALD
jgi:hypothetical protein